MRAAWMLAGPVVLLAAGLVSAAASAQTAAQPPPEADRAWLVALARVEGAAIDAKDAAAALSATSQRIIDGGRLTALAELSSDASDVNRRVISAKLATEVLVEAASADR